MEITVEVHHEDESYWAEVPELPGCLTAAGTLSELGVMLEDAVRLWLEDPSVRLEHPQLEPGTVRVRVSRAGERSSVEPQGRGGLDGVRAPRE